MDQSNDPIPDGYKRCSGNTPVVCGEVKSVEDFYRNKGMRDGRLKQCKECTKSSSLLYNKDEERDRENHRKWLAKNPDRRKEHTARYRDAHREICNSRTAAWQKENKDKVNATRNARRAANPEQTREEWRAGNQLRKARIRGAGKREYIKPGVVFERDGGKCHICGRLVDPNDWHLDHIVPVSRGGSHTYANVAVSHPYCNMSKGNRGGGEQLRII